MDLAPAMQTRVEADRSFERLYELHRVHVFRAALRALGNVHDAEDVTQTAFVDAYRALLRGSQPESPRAWLLAIAENVRHRRFRLALRRPQEEALDADAAPAPEVSHEQAEALRAALATLSAQQREVFLLREIYGLSYEEISARLESTVAAVQMLLFRARRALRIELDPPPVPRRRTFSLQLPGWLAHLAARGDTLTLSLTPRGAGAVGALVIAVGGVSAGVVDSRQTQPPSRSAHEQLQRAPMPGRATVAQRADQTRLVVGNAAPKNPSAARSKPVSATPRERARQRRAAAPGAPPPATVPGAQAAQPPSIDASAEPPTARQEQAVPSESPAARVAPVVPALPSSPKAPVSPEAPVSPAAPAPPATPAPPAVNPPAAPAVPPVTPPVGPVDPLPVAPPAVPVAPPLPPLPTPPVPLPPVPIP